MQKLKSAPPPDIDAYITEFPAAVQAMLNKLRSTIKRAAPKATEAIKYRMPTFVLGENLIHFAAYKHHIGLYPTSSGIKAFARELSRWKSSRGAVQFPLDAPLPLRLIARIVRFRVKEAGARSRRD